jgi:hypothetical protein
MRIALLAAVVALGVAPAAPTAPPTAVPATPTLPNIGTTKTTVKPCLNVARANTAIELALANDAALAHSIVYLRKTFIPTYDNWSQGSSGLSHIKQLQALHEIEREGIELRRSAQDGIVQIETLRQTAADSRDPLVRQNLNAFANSLGDALEKQKAAAVNLQQMVVIFEGREAKKDADRSYNEAKALAPKIIGSSTTDEYMAIANDAADGFQAAQPKIAADENDAAEHSDEIASSC